MAQHKVLSPSFLDTLVESLRNGITPQQGLRLAFKKALAILDCQGALFQTVNGTFMPFHTPYPLPPLLVNTLEDRIKADSAPSFTLTFTRKNMKILATGQRLRHGEWIISCLWRKNTWYAHDKNILSLFWKFVATLLDLETLYHNALSRTNHDPGTGLLTWKGMEEEINRRLSRLDKNGLAGTLLLVQINGIHEIARKHGPEIEEKTIRHCLNSLRRTIRPTDLVGRIGQNLFTLWLDGGDRFAAAERAESLTQQAIPLPFLPGVTLTLQIGLSCREADSNETTAGLLEQAILALRSTKEQQGQAWHFAHQQA